MRAFLRARPLGLVVAAVVLTFFLMAWPHGATYGMRGIDPSFYAEFPLSNLMPAVGSGVLAAGLQSQLPAAEANAARNLWPLRLLVIGGSIGVFAALNALATLLTDTRLPWSSVRDTLFYVGLSLAGVRLGRGAWAFIVPAGYIALITVGGVAGGGDPAWWALPGSPASNVASTALALGIFVPSFVVAVVRPVTSDPETNDVT